MKPFDTRKNQFILFQILYIKNFIVSYRLSVGFSNHMLHCPRDPHQSSVKNQDGSFDEASTRKVNFVKQTKCNIWSIIF